MVGGAPYLPTLHNIVRRNVEWGAPVFGGDGPRRTPAQGCLPYGMVNQVAPEQLRPKGGGDQLFRCEAPELLLSLCA